MEVMRVVITAGTGVAVGVGVKVGVEVGAGVNVEVMVGDGGGVKVEGGGGVSVGAAGDAGALQEVKIKVHRARTTIKYFIGFSLWCAWFGWQII